MLSKLKLMNGLLFDYFSASIHSGLFLHFHPALDLMAVDATDWTTYKQK